MPKGKGQRKGGGSDDDDSDEERPEVIEVPPPLMIVSHLCSFALFSPQLLAALCLFVILLFSLSHDLQNTQNTSLAL